MHIHKLHYRKFPAVRQFCPKNPNKKGGQTEDEEIRPINGEDEEIRPINGEDEEIRPINGEDEEIRPINGEDEEIRPINGEDTTRTRFNKHRL